MKILKRIPTEIIIFGILSLLIFFQHIQSPPFSLVDDGYSLTMGRSLVTDFSFQNWKDSIIESDIGRIRPIYLLYFSLIYIVSGTNPIGLWLGQIIVIWLTLILFFKIILLFNRNQNIAYLFVILWLLMPTVSENIFRAGTAEPRQLLFSLLFIYSLLSKKILTVKSLFFSGVVLLLAIGTKETSILLIPSGLYYFLTVKFPKINSSKLFLFISVGLPLLLVISFLCMKLILPTGYAIENFSIDPIGMLKATKNVARSYPHYSLLSFLSLIFLVMRLYIAYITKRTKEFYKDLTLHYVFLLLILQSIFFVIAWKFHFERYFYLTWSFFILYFALEISKWKEFSKQILTSIKLITANQFFFLSCMLFSFLIVIIGTFFSKNPFFIITLPLQSISIYKASYDSTQISHSIIELLMQNESVSEIYLTNDGYEIMYEVSMYASQFMERPISVFSPNTQLPNDRKNEGFYYIQDPIQGFLVSKERNKILIGTLNEFEMLTTYNLDTQVRIIKPNILYGIIDTKHHWWIMEDYGNN